MSRFIFTLRLLTPFLSSNSTSCTERWEHFKHECFLNELIRDKDQQGQLLL